MSGKNRMLTLCVCCLQLLGSTAACGQRTPGGNAPDGGTSGSAADSVAAREFVQGFYNRYVASRREKPDRGYWSVLGSAALDGRLAAALREDSAFGGVNDAPREGLNFDPFLASNDPCPRYEVVAARRSEEGFRVKVNPVCVSNEWQQEGPMVVVRRQNDRWLIMNVLYERTDLLAVLCDNAKQDKTAKGAPAACPN
jgi:hypothetical protein